MTTTTMENLLAQIFDQKSFIINQVKEQADSCAQQLASKLIIDGFDPPDWFHNPNFDHDAPNRNELEKEELIFKLLRRPSRDSVSYARSDCSLYYRPVFTGGKGLNASSMSVRTQGPNNDAGCSLNCVVEHADNVNDHQKETDANKSLNVSNGPMATVVGPNNDGVNSPHNETDARISSIYAVPDTSVARIQRSKSRQKALERRTNSKTAAKSCLSDENRTHHSYNGDSIPKIDFRQGTQEKCSSEAAKHSNIIGAASIAAEGNDRTGHISRLAKSSTSYEQPSFVNDHAKHDSSLEKEELDGSILVQPTDDLVLQAVHVNVMEGVNFPDVSLGSDTRKSSINRKIQDSEGQNNPISGRITRFRSSSQQTSGMSNSSILLKSASNNLTGSSAQQSGHGIGVTEEVNVLDFSVGSYVSKTSTTEKTQDTQRQNQPILGRITRFRSSIQQTSEMSKSSRPPKSASNLLTGSSAQHSGHGIDVTEEVNALDFSLGSYPSKISTTEKTQDTQRQIQPILGRLTRSRSSSQQISGMNKSSKQGTSASYKLQNGEDAVPCFVDASNKLVDAVETSQRLSDQIGETQADSSSDGLLKPVISSNIAAPRVTQSRSGCPKESALGVVNLENAEPVVENGATDVPAVVQPVASGMNLVPITLCTTLEGLASKPSSDCCMIVKPKQLNFDEIEESDLDKTCSPLSKKRKMDGLQGQECFTLDVAVSSVDHKSISPFCERRLSDAKALSSSPKAADTLSDNNNNDERMNDETTNLGLETDENLVGGDVEDNSKISPYNIIDATCEVSASLKEVTTVVDEENLQEVSHSKDHASSLKMQIEEGDINDKDEESDGAYTSDKNCDECINDEMANLGLETHENPVLDDVEDNSKVNQYDDIYANCEINTSVAEVQSISDEENNPEESHSNKDQATSLKAQVEEDDLCQEGKESAAGILSRSTSSPFILSAIKQGNTDSENRNDLGSSKSKQYEAGTNLKLSDAKLSSANANNTWPINQQRNDEDQTTCLSDSRDFRVHIQRDAILCDLEAPEKDIHSLRESASITSSEDIHASQLDDIEDEMACKLPEETESVHELQAAEETVTEVDFEKTETTCSLAAEMGATNPSINDDVVTDNMNFEISLPKWVSSYISVQSSNDDKTVVVSDEALPVYESFIINEEVENANLEHADFDSLELPSTTIERASILEQICKSATMQTPLSQFSSSFTQHSTDNLYEYMADEMYENMDLGTTLSIDEDSEADSDFRKQHNFDSLPFATTPFCWESKNQYSSPMGKLWDRSASSSGSSEKNLSSNPELTCFPIEEDPNSDEESEKDDEAVEIQEPPSESLIQNPMIISSEMNILTENDDKVADDNQEPPVESSSMKYPDRYSSYSVDTEASVPKTRDTVKFKSKFHPGVKISRFDEDSRKSSIATRASSRGNLSDYKNRSIMRSGIPRSTKKEAKGNNIVSNISSFIPMVQQKQAAAVCTGKRDIKVKALEAAEAAKRREQEKENERKKKKEALKLERARIGKENAIEMELNKKKKNEEQKKKEADIAARKRQREEEEKKQVAKKRKLVAEAQKNHKLQYEKSRAGKAESEKQQGKNGGNAGNRKGADNMRQNKNTVKNSLQQKDTELRTDKSLASVVQQVTSVSENQDASNDSGVNETVTRILENLPVKVGLVNSTQELSYDMSPYQSDDDDDEEDNQPTKKFIPSWCSKSRVAMVIPLQQQIDPVKIFSLESFCNMDEVLLPRRLQAH